MTGSVIAVGALAFGALGYGIYRLASSKTREESAQLQERHSVPCTLEETEENECPAPLADLSESQKEQDDSPPEECEAKADPLLNLLKSHFPPPQDFQLTEADFRVFDVVVKNAVLISPAFKHARTLC